jgi:hypothetical protein
LNDNFASLHSRAIGFSVNAINSLMARVNFEYNFDYSYAISSFPGTALNPVTGMKQSLKLDVFPIKDQSLTVMVRYFTSRPAIKPNKLFTNLKYMVTLPKTKTDLAVTVNNLLNAHTYVNQYNYEYATYYNELYLRPRQVLFSVRFNFN